MELLNDFSISPSQLEASVKDRGKKPSENSSFVFFSFFLLPTHLQISKISIMHIGL